MKRPFCRPGLLWEYTITVSCHCLMPSPFMQDIQEGARRGANAGWGGTPGEEPALTAKVLPTGGSPGGSRGDSDWRLTRREQGKSDWRTTLFN